MRMEKGSRRAKRVTAAFGRFLQQQIDSRNMSHNDFAKVLGVSQSTISRYISGVDSEPSLGVLRKISQAIGIPLGSLIAMAYPDVATDLMIDPDIAILVNEFNSLPKSAREIILAAVRGIKTSGGNTE